MSFFRRRDPLAIPWREAEFLVLDLETTGLDLISDSIVSYGAVPVRNGRVISGQSLYGLVRPDRPPTPASIQVHTLRDKDLQEAPSLKQAMELLSRNLAGQLLVAHAAWIEESFLRRGLAHIGIHAMPNIIDTAALARAAGMASRGTNVEPDLEQLSTALGLPVIDPHHALGDALTTAGLFIALASKLETRGEHTARDLLEVSVCYARGTN